MPIQSKNTAKQLWNAKQLWEMFYKKYTHPAEITHFPLRYAKKLSEFERSNFIDSLTTKGSTPKVIEAKMQSFKRKKRKNAWHNSKLTINNRNYNTKLKALLSALDQGDWYNKIFRDKQITELSLSLYNANKISYQQLSSILERPQIKTPKDAHFYPILNKNGEFTKEAQDILLPELLNYYFLAPPTDAQLNEFKLLISTLPKSERFFYCLSPAQHTSTLKHRSLPLDKAVGADNGGDARFASPSRKSPPKPKILNDHFDIIRLTAGARDALGLVRFGLDDYVPAATSRLTKRYQ